METFIPAEDVLARIKYHPDITPKEKEKFKEQLLQQKQQYPSIAGDIDVEQEVEPFKKRYLK